MKKKELHSIKDPNSDRNTMEGGKKYLVTGGAGFLGSCLVNRLIHEGHTVICLDNEFRGSFDNLSQLPAENLILKRGDIRKLEDWPKDCGKIDGLFHLGAINGTSYFYSIPDIVLDVNVKGIMNALEFIRQNDINYLSFASSPEAYGVPEVFPTPETESLMVPDIDNPRWSYGASKIIGEIYCANFAKKFGFKCSILRYNNTYGPGDKQGHVIPDLIRKLINNEKIIVEGTGNETRAFCFVEDAINATILIKEKQSSTVDVFNVGTDVETRIKDVVNLLAKISGRKIKPVFVPKKNPGTLRRLPDLTKIRKLGYTPRTSLEAGLRLTFEWHKKNQEIC